MRMRGGVTNSSGPGRRSHRQGPRSTTRRHDLGQPERRRRGSHWWRSSAATHSWLSGAISAASTGPGTTGALAASRRTRAASGGVERFRVRQLLCWDGTLSYPGRGRSVRAARGAAHARGPDSRLPQLRVSDALPLSADMARPEKEAAAQVCEPQRRAVSAPSVVRLAPAARSCADAPHPLPIALTGLARSRAPCPCSRCWARCPTRTRRGTMGQARRATTTRASPCCDRRQRVTVVAVVVVVSLVAPPPRSAAYASCVTSRPADVGVHVVVDVRFLRSFACVEACVGKW